MIKCVSNILFSHRALLVICSCACFCALMSLFTPYNSDDLYYAMPYRNPQKIGEFSVQLPSFRYYLATMHVHYLEVNARFGDKLLLPLMMLPKWLFALLTGLLTGVIFSVPRYIFKNKWSNSLSILAATLMLACLPWYDKMFSLAFTVNYIWGAAICLYAFPFLIGLKAPLGIISRITSCVIVVIASIWHEGFSVVIFAGISAFYCMRGLRLSPMQWIYWSLWLAGTICTLTSPASWQRLDTLQGLPAIWEMTDKHLLIYYNLSLLLIPLVVYALISRGLRTGLAKRGMWPLMSAITIMLLVNLCMYYRTSYDARIALFSAPWAICAVIYLMFMILEPLKINIKSKLRCAIEMLCLLFLTIHISVTLYWQIRLSEEVGEILLKAQCQSVREAQSNQSVSYDSIPFMALGKPSTYILTINYSRAMLEQYYNLPPKSLTGVRCDDD